MSRVGFDQLSVRSSTKKYVTSQCVEEFKRQNPEYKDKYGVKITQDFIVNRLARYYLGERW